MALRDKLARRSAPYLEPGEQIQAVFLAQSGPNPYFILLAFIIILIGARYAVVVVTDRAVVVLRAGMFTPTFPKRVVVRLNRGTWLGDPSGLWGKIQLDKRYWVHKRFHKDVRAANQMLAAMYPAGPPPMQPPPPPYGPPPGPPQYVPPPGAPTQYSPPPQSGPPPGPPQYGPPPQQPYGAPPGHYGPPPQ